MSPFSLTANLSFSIRFISNFCSSICNITVAEEFEPLLEPEPCRDFFDWNGEVDLQEVCQLQAGLNFS